MHFTFSVPDGRLTPPPRSLPGFWPPVVFRNKMHAYFTWKFKKNPKWGGCTTHPSRPPSTRPPDLFPSTPTVIYIIITHFIFMTIVSNCYSVRTYSSCWWTCCSWQMRCELRTQRRPNRRFESQHQSRPEPINQSIIYLFAHNTSIYRTEEMFQLSTTVEYVIQWRPHDRSLSRIDMIPGCDTRTDRQTWTNRQNRSNVSTVNYCRVIQWRPHHRSLSRFDMIQGCDGQTDGRMDGIYHSALHSKLCWRAVKTAQCMHGEAASWTRWAMANSKFLFGGGHSALIGNTNNWPVCSLIRRKISKISKAKMHRIRFPLGSARNPAGAAYGAPPDTLAVF